MLRLILPAFACASKVLKMTCFPRDVSYTWGVLCPISSILAYLHLLLIDTHGRPLTHSRLFPSSSLCYRGRESLGSFQATVFALGPLQQLCNAAFQVTLSRPWAGGPVMHINSTLEPQWNQFWKFLGGYFSNRYLIKGGSKHIRSGDFGFGRYGLGRLPARSPFSEP